MSEGRDAISRDPRINAKPPASQRGGAEGMKSHSPWVSSRLVSDETPSVFFFFKFYALNTFPASPKSGVDGSLMVCFTLASLLCLFCFHPWLDG